MIIKPEDVKHEECDRTEMVHMGYVWTPTRDGMMKRFREVHFVCPDDGTHFTWFDNSESCLRIHAPPEYCGGCPKCPKEGRKGANVYVTGESVDGVIDWQHPLEEIQE